MRSTLVMLLPFLLVSMACGGGDGGDDTSPRALTSDGRLDVTIVTPVDAPGHLTMAARDLAAVLAAAAGVEVHDGVFTTSDGAFDPGQSEAGVVILAGVLPVGGAALAGPTDDPRQRQGFVISEQALAGRVVLSVASPSAIGVSYGLYEIAARLGVVWHHPRETHLPVVQPGLELPTDFQAPFEDAPDTRLRGFHQHTQHPIVWSDYCLVADAAHRQPITEYLRYLLRNRQNLFEWHMLKTVDWGTWPDHAAWIVEEGHRHGVLVGLVTSFADKQQNAYRLVEDLGESLPLEERLPHQADQVRAGMARLAAIGFDLLGFQFGTTEMTAISDAETLGWFEAAAAWQREHAPTLEVYAWVHTPKHLMAEDGETPFFHLPLQAPPEIGLYIHTTMFYDLEHPAPVYGNEDFRHHHVAFTEGVGQRAVVYFPETAWWLGFDNSLPLFLPVTLSTRAWDMQEVIPPLIGDTPLDGHVTFTTGIEWGYWLFDLYVARLAWDASLDWRAFVPDAARVFGGAGPELATAIITLADRQTEDFLGAAPLRFFYLAGESEGDELGMSAGLGGRPAKPPFWEVYTCDDEPFDAWVEGDLAWLNEVRSAYHEIHAAVTPCAAGPDDPLLVEMCAALGLSAARAEQAYLHYAAVADARAGDEGAAYAKLELARLITEQVKETVADVEARVYRWPLELLAEEKPQSLTPYKFGYLWETRTAHFWSRRDEQLQELLDVVFGHVTEDFDFEPEVVYASERAKTEVLEPDVASAAKVLIKSYVPTLLFALGAPDDGLIPVTLAEDLNANGQPDIGARVSGALSEDDDPLVLTFDAFPLQVGSQAAPAGTLTIRDGTFTATLTAGAVTAGELSGDVRYDDILHILKGTGMFDDVTGWEMIADQFGFDPDAEPRPETFPMTVSAPFGPTGARTR